jgi:hypothetical protein
MFRPELINGNDPAYANAGDAAFRGLEELVAVSQRHGWRSDADTTEVAISTWALIHGLALLRRQGTLALYLPDTSPEAINRASLTLTGLVATTPSSPHRSKRKGK